MAELLYREILEAGDPRAAINMGTMAFDRRDFERARELYLRALDLDPTYTLAWFNLGNALEELLRTPEAMEAYRTALRLNPQYADAHYNLALALARSEEPRRGLKHWNSYLKLDRTGKCANHARAMIRRVLATEGMTLVRPRKRKTA